MATIKREREIDEDEDSEGSDNFQYCSWDKLATANWLDSKERQQRPLCYLVTSYSVVNESK